MFQIDANASGMAGTMPAPATAETQGWFQDTAIPGTQVTADWLNMIQAELINAVEGAGLTPNKNAFNQLLLAIQAISAANALPPGVVQAYAAPGATPAGWLPCDG